MTNYYAILGVRPHASGEAIKSAYRQAARKTHPDHQGDAEHFRQLRTAYEVLSDPGRRSEYDRARRAWMQQLGAVGCPDCGHANRITRRPRGDERVRCWHCKTPLPLAWVDLLQAQRQSLANEAARVVDEVGVDLADLAADAVTAGIARLRRRLGLAPQKRLKP